MLGSAVDAESWRGWLERAVRMGMPDEENPRKACGNAVGEGWPAAVLIAVEAGPDPAIYFTQRSHSLTHHPGQISFPGGRLEPNDMGLAEAALREAKEEIGLDSGCVTVLGRLPSFNTGTGFTIAPFVGWVDPVPSLTPDGQEVVQIFSVPLSYAFQAVHYRAGRFHHNGQDRLFYSIDFNGHYIWGATASILIGLARRIAWVRGQPFAMPDPEAS